MPRFDGPYVITATDKKHSTVTLDLPNKRSYFPVFHTSEVKTFKENDDTLFPTRALHLPNPISIDGTQEFFMDKIVDERCQGKGRQYLVRWKGEGPEGDIWLPASELEDCEALDQWQTSKAENVTCPQGNECPQLTITIPPPHERNDTCLLTEQGGVKLHHTTIAPDRYPIKQAISCYRYPNDLRIYIPLTDHIRRPYNTILIHHLSHPFSPLHYP